MSKPTKREAVAMTKTRGPLIVHVSSELPPSVRLALLMPVSGGFGFGEETCFLTGAYDELGRPVYGDPQ